jgi:uncharacterized membrane protein YuzA (DUF378 family)
MAKLKRANQLVPGRAMAHNAQKNQMKSFFHIFTILGCLAAGFVIVTDMAVATTVFQQIEVLAEGIALVVGCPLGAYCFARAVEQLAGR